MIRPRGFCEREKCCMETKSGESLEISLTVFLGMDIRMGAFYQEYFSANDGRGLVSKNMFTHEEKTNPNFS